MAPKESPKNWKNKVKVVHNELWLSDGATWKRIKSIAETKTALEYIT